MTYTHDEIAKILAAHAEWLASDGTAGDRANLTGADLTKANFYRADLRSANLAGADLTEAKLAFAKLTDAKLARADLCDLVNFYYRITRGRAVAQAPLELGPEGRLDELDEFSFTLGFMEVVIERAL